MGAVPLVGSRYHLRDRLLLSLEHDKTDVRQAGLNGRVCHANGPTFSAVIHLISFRSLDELRNIEDQGDTAVTENSCSGQALDVPVGSS